MTVEELIEKLAGLDKTLDVVTRFVSEIDGCLTYEVIETAGVIRIGSMGEASGNNSKKVVLLI